MERLVRAGCSLGNIRAEEASGARNDRGGLLELLDLVVEGDTLVVTHIDRLSRGLTHGLQVIEGLHRAGVEFRSLSEDFDTATAALAGGSCLAHSRRRRAVCVAALHRARADLASRDLLPRFPQGMRRVAGFGDDLCRGALCLEPLAWRAALYLRGALDGS